MPENKKNNQPVGEMIYSSTNDDAFALPNPDAVAYHKYLESTNDPEQYAHYDYIRENHVGICHGLTSRWLLNIANEGRAHEDSKPDQLMGGMIQGSIYGVKNLKYPPPDDFIEQARINKYGFGSYYAERDKHFAQAFGLETAKEQPVYGELKNVGKTIEKSPGLYQLSVLGHDINNDSHGHTLGIDVRQSPSYLYDPNNGLMKFNSASDIFEEINARYNDPYNNPGGEEFKYAIAFQIMPLRSRAERSADAPLNDIQGTKRKLGSDENELTPVSKIPKIETPELRPEGRNGMQQETVQDASTQDLDERNRDRDYGR